MSRVCALLLVVIAVSCRAKEYRKDLSMKQRTMPYDPFGNECEFSRTDRQECGSRTYDETECRLRGCCHEICDGPDCTGVPWCFLAKRMLRAECQVDYRDKEDCGYYGITEGQCYMRGCCWAPSPLTNDPYCFTPGAPLDSQVRLVDGTEGDGHLSGRVEVEHDGVWGTVCDDNFGQTAADVVCRSLGYQYAEARENAPFGQGSGPILMDGLMCRGDEDSIRDCAFEGWGSHDCGHHEDAGALCSNEPFTSPQEEYVYPSENETDTYNGTFEYPNYYNYYNDSGYEWVRLDSPTRREALSPATRLDRDRSPTRRQSAMKKSYPGGKSFDRTLTMAKAKGRSPTVARGRSVADLSEVLTKEQTRKAKHVRTGEKNMMRKEPEVYRGARMSPTRKRISKLAAELRKLTERATTN